MNPAMPLLTELIELLDEQIRLHAALRDTLAQEAAQDGRISSGDLLRTQHRKYHLAEQIAAHESRRMEIVRGLAAEWDVAPEALRLRAIIARAGQAPGNELRRCHATLSDQIAAIGELAQAIARNAGARLKAVEATLNVIQDAVDTHVTYSGAGRLKRRAPSFKHTAV